MEKVKGTPKQRTFLGSERSFLVSFGVLNLHGSFLMGSEKMFTF